MIKKSTPNFLFTVNQDEISLINVYDYLEDIDKQLDELLGVFKQYEPKEETVNTILKLCK